MNTNFRLLICSSLLLTFSGVLDAADRAFSKGVVVDTAEHTKVLPHRSKATDAPPPSTEYDHDVTIRLACTQYVVRYRSELEYLPTAFTPGQSIDVSPDKGVMYAKIPGNKDARMSIIRQEDVKGDASCASGK